MMLYLPLPLIKYLELIAGRSFLEEVYDLIAQERERKPEPESCSLELELVRLTLTLHVYV